MGDLEKHNYGRFLPIEDCIQKKGLIRGPFGGSLKKDFFVKNGYSVYEQRNAIYNDFTKSRYFIDESLFKELERFKIKKGDLIVSCSGTIGKIAEVPKRFNGGIINQALMIIRINEEKIDKSFFFQTFKSSSFQNKIIKSTQGGAMKNMIGISDFKKIKLLVPDKKEQKKIAQILSKWDEAIETTQTLIEKLQVRKKGLMQELLSGKKRLAGFSDEWKEFRFDNLLKDVRRPVDWNDQELYNLISVRRRSGGLFFRESLYGHQILTKNLKTAKIGDFLISKMQIVHGASGLVTKEFDGAKISGSYLALRVIDETITDINFIDWLSKTPYFYYQTLISSYGVHIEKMTFDFKLFQKSKIKIPSIEEQRKIVKILEAAQTEIFYQENKLKQLNSSKKGLMQQLLTGKKRVKI